MRRPGWIASTVLVAALWCGPQPVAAQTDPAQTGPPQTEPAPPAPAERLGFREAVQRAIDRNPSAAIAAAGILRADALLRQIRATTLLNVSVALTNTTLNTGVDFEDQVVTPRNQSAATLDITMPLYAPALWARRTQAKDQKEIANLSAAEVRRQTAVAAANAYLTVIGIRRLVEANVRAREVSGAHYELARQRQVGGVGSRLNELRAQEEFTSNNTIVEAARIALYRSQEALGVLLAADGPVDASEDPVFEPPPPTLESTAVNLIQWRADLQLFSARSQAADRVVRDSWKDYLPTLTGLFQPQAVYPSQFFLPANSWRTLLVLSVPIYDSKFRAGVKQERQADFDESKAVLAGAVTQAQSEVRTAREAVQSAERALESARAAADQARSVVEIVNVSYSSGGATNIEVIDAQRRSRDSDNAVAIAEDAVRRAHLEWLTAVGRFP